MHTSGNAAWRINRQGCRRQEGFKESTDSRRKQSATHVWR